MGDGRQAPEPAKDLDAARKAGPEQGPAAGAGSLLSDPSLTAAGAGSNQDGASPLGQLLKAADRGRRVGLAAHVQRTLGNQAMQRLLEPGAVVQRDLDPSQVKITGDDLKSTGKTTATVSSSAVRVVGPDVSMNAQAAVQVPSTDDGGWDKLDAGPGIEVGPTQTLLGSTRSINYHKGGTPSGEKVAEQKTTVPQSRDAQPNNAANVEKDPKTGMKKAADPNASDVPAPWYQRHPRLNAATPAGAVPFHDQPEQFNIPLKVGDGVITNMWGSDDFITSLAIKPEKGALTHANKWSWSTDWNIDIDAAKGGVGAGTVVNKTERIPPTLDGPIAARNAKTWTVFNTIEAAMSVPAPELLRYLAEANAADPAAAHNIMEALKQKNPVFAVSINVVKKGNYWRKDNMQVHVTANKGTVIGELGAMEDGGSSRANIALVDLIDLKTYTPETKVVYHFVRTGVWDDHGKKSFTTRPYEEGSEIDFQITGGAYKGLWLGLQA